MRTVRYLVFLVVGCLAVATGSAAADEPQQRSAADAVQLVHDELKLGYEAGDAAAVTQAVGRIDAVLASLSAPDVRTAVSSQVTAEVTEAGRLNGELAAELAALRAGGKAGLPGLGMLTDLVGSLLSTLLGLVSTLVSSLPVSVRVPALPSHPDF